MKKLKKQMKPPQTQSSQPGVEYKMNPKPIFDNSPSNSKSRKLEGKVAIVTGGDSGIGKAVSIAYAQEGADVAIVYLNEDKDAQETKKLVEAEGSRCLLISGDIGKETFCKKVAAKVLREFGKIDIVVNNAGEQHPKESIEEITEAQIIKTFRTNIFSHFFMVKAALPSLSEGAVIINTASITAYQGSPQLLDYSSTKGAVVSFTRSLALSLVERGIRVNGVAPGAVWTPLIPSTFSKQKVKEFGTDNPMKRAGEPAEIAPAFVFLACDDSIFMAGQILHPNGGEIING